MKVWRKFTAVALALVMMLAMSVSASASAALSEVLSGDKTYQSESGDGEATIGQAGTFYEEDGDGHTAYTAYGVGKVVTLKKEITAYNPYDEEDATTSAKLTTLIAAPTITYNYMIEKVNNSIDGGADTNLTVADAPGKHAENSSVTAPVWNGVHPEDVELNGQAGTATTKGVISWTTSDSLDANKDGVANYKNLTVDFTDVVFGKSGVFRYKITETLADGFNYGNADSGANTAVTGTDGSHARYLDVYVKAADSFTGGSAKTDWEIYGYTCFYNNLSISEDTKNTPATVDGTTTSSAVKTFGFVAGTTDGSTTLKADSYYTYDLYVSKMVENDNFAANTHNFPFTVILTNSVVAKTVRIITEIEQKDSSKGYAVAEDFIGSTGHTATAKDANTTAQAGYIEGVFATSNNPFQGVLGIRHNTVVKYIGIPCGTTFEVYETNDVVGTTYYVTTSINGGEATAGAADNDFYIDSAVTGVSTTPDTASAQNTTKNAQESTKVTGTPTINAKATRFETVDIINALLNISPTGVTLRYAPYLAMLGAGIVALPLSIRRKREDF